MYARLGANVVVNDVSEKGANAVVEEIAKSTIPHLPPKSHTDQTFPKAGGKAAAAVGSVEDGDAIVKVALEKFGGVHILVANAGILRDKSFTSLTEPEWEAVCAVHLRYAISSCISS